MGRLHPVARGCFRAAHRQGLLCGGQLGRASVMSRPGAVCRVPGEQTLAHFTKWPLRHVRRLPNHRVCIFFVMPNITAVASERHRATAAGYVDGMRGDAVIKVGAQKNSTGGETTRTGTRQLTDRSLLGAAKRMRAEPGACPCRVRHHRDSAKKPQQLAGGAVNEPNGHQRNGLLVPSQEGLFSLGSSRGVCGKRASGLTARVVAETSHSTRIRCTPEKSSQTALDE